MLMDPDVRRIDENIFEIGIIRQTLENPLPSALLCPPPEPSVDGEPVSELPRQITPGRTSSCDPKYRLNEQPVVTCGRTGITGLARKFWCNSCPLLIAQYGANQG